MGRSGQEGVHALLEALDHGSDFAAFNAIYGLQTAGVSAVLGLLGLLENNQNITRRGWAIFTLGMIGSDAYLAVPVLINLLRQDESEWVKRNAAEALGVIRQPAGEIVPALVQALEYSHAHYDPIEQGYIIGQPYIHNRVGYTCALSLLRLSREEETKLGVEVLINALESEDRYVRGYASEALTHIKSDQAIEAIISYLHTTR